MTISTNVKLVFQKVVSDILGDSDRSDVTLDYYKIKYSFCLHCRKVI